MRLFGNIHMIDREARDKLAAALRSFACGNLSNFGLEGRTPSSNDPAVGEIADYVWRYYDDYLEQKMTGLHTLSLGTRRDFARCILFLKSEHPYQWAPNHRFAYSFWTGCKLSVGRILSCFTGRLVSIKDTQPRPNGDLRVWPFYSMRDYRQSVRKPPYLSKGNHNL